MQLPAANGTKNALHHPTGVVFAAPDPEVSNRVPQIARRACEETVMLDFAPQLHVGYSNGVMVVHLPGADMSEEAALALGRQLGTLAERLRSRCLILNLGDVRFVSSAMLGKLIAFHKQVRQRGGELALCSLTPELAARFESMRLDRLFHICSTEEEALAEWDLAPPLVNGGVSSGSGW
jgi:anti-anti-sigma factor